MKRIVTTSGAPKPVGPYSQAVIAGGLVFLSGQGPLDPATNRLVDGDTAAQTERVLENLKAVLEALIYVAEEPPTVAQIAAALGQPPERIQTLLGKGIVELLSGVPLDPTLLDVFLCGNPDMIQTVKEVLAPRGFTPDHGKRAGTIHVEEYW